VKTLVACDAKWLRDNKKQKPNKKNNKKQQTKQIAATTTSKHASEMQENPVRGTIKLQMPLFFKKSHNCRVVSCIGEIQQPNSAL
jgi:hypothetical protein